MMASRISHSTASNGLTPASVKRLPTLTPSPAAVMAGAVALRLSGMTSPRVGDSSWRPQGGKTDTALGPDGLWPRPRAPADRRREGGRPCSGWTRLASSSRSAEIAVHGREQDRRHRVELRRARARRGRRSGSPRPPGRTASPPPRSTPTVPPAAPSSRAACWRPARALPGASGCRIARGGRHA